MTLYASRKTGKRYVQAWANGQYVGLRPEPEENPFGDPVVKVKRSNLTKSYKELPQGEAGVPDAIDAADARHGRTPEAPVSPAPSKTSGGERPDAGASWPRQDVRSGSERSRHTAQPWGDTPAQAPASRPPEVPAPNGTGRHIPATGEPPDKAPLWFTAGCAIAALLFIAVIAYSVGRL